MTVNGLHMQVAGIRNGFTFNRNTSTRNDPDHFINEESFETQSCVIVARNLHLMAEFMRMRTL